MPVSDVFQTIRTIAAAVDQVATPTRTIIASVNQMMVPLRAVRVACKLEIPTLSNPMEMK